MPESIIETEQLPELSFIRKVNIWYIMDKNSWRRWKYW